MSNGMPIVLRAAVKPVPTMRKPLDSIDIVSGEAGRAHIERSDVAIMPRAAIVGEAMAALVLADALLTSFGGDTIGDLRAAVARRRRREKRPQLKWPRSGCSARTSATRPRPRCTARPSPRSVWATTTSSPT